MLKTHAYGDFVSMQLPGVALGMAAIAWMGLIFYLSSLSGAEASQGLELGAISWLGELRSYAAHIALYAVLAALIQAALWGWNLGFRLRWAMIAGASASLFGASDEYHQSFVIGRSATLTDGLVDTVAALTAAVLLWGLAAAAIRMREMKLRG